MLKSANPGNLVIDGPIQLEMVRVPTGAFLMGSNPATDNFARPDELPKHSVFVSEFHIGRYEVTNAQFGAFAHAVGLSFEQSNGSDDHPVVRVSWHEAVSFCEWLSEAAGTQIRLPTEAEWEKAARGTDGRLYPWGDRWDPSGLNSSEGGVGGTTLVHQFAPASDSPYGASDMVGNVWEWTQDWYHSDTYQDRLHTGQPIRDPGGVATGTHRVLRGGSCYFRQSGSRAAYRYKYVPTSRCYDIGFRVAMGMAAG